jgi:methyl-accepting chemotaxis protein
MEIQQIRMVQESFEKMVPHTEVISERFYEHLFRIDPSMKPLFRTDIQSQSRKFMAMIRVTVKGLDRMEQIRPGLVEMGARHIYYGVADAHYEPMKEALLLAFGEALGDEFTPELKQAWNEAYDLMAEVMISAAHRRKREI